MIDGMVTQALKRYPSQTTRMTQADWFIWNLALIALYSAPLEERPKIIEQAHQSCAWAKEPEASTTATM